jgi:predicted DsbA family dithiol-disulfide isomerase
MKVEIWSDVVCPFCYIGKRKFEGALEQFAHRDEVEVVWHSFQLDPTAPATVEGSTRDRLAAQFGGRERADAMIEHVTNEAASVGLPFDFDQMRPANTFDAHRLIHLAAALGLQDAAEERLFAAHFIEGREIGDHDTLREQAAAIGLDPDATATALASDAHADAVRADLAEAGALGISGVPFFVLDRKYGVSGAQPTETFLEVLQQVWAERNPLTMIGGNNATDTTDAACTDDSCAVPAR